jgi:DNA-binding IclR family transcriptional regulator
MASERINVGLTSLSGWHAMQLLHLFANRQEIGISEIARSLTMSKTAVQRLVNALAKFEFLEQNPITRRYRIGVGALYVGSLYLKGRSLENEARPFMRDTVRDLGHTCQLAVLHDGAMIITVSIEGPGPIKYSVPVGHRLPVHTSATGKAVLSMRDDAEVEAILADIGMPQRTTKSMRTPAAMKEFLRQVRTRGYATNWEENQAGIGSIAAPIADGHSVSAVGIAFPVSVVRKADIPVLGARIAECARAISRRLTVLSKPSAA